MKSLLDGTEGTKENKGRNARRLNQSVGSSVLFYIRPSYNLDLLAQIE